MPYAFFYTLTKDKYERAKFNRCCEDFRYTIKDTDDNYGYIMNVVNAMMVEYGNYKDYIYKCINIY